MREICERCIMDTSDPLINFDEQGVCNHCRTFDDRYKAILEQARGPLGPRKLANVVERIKEKGKGRDYDCLIGISGGVDSTYLAWKAKELGLRPLAVHFDSGWNSELAVNNIENIVKRLNLDLVTHVVDWEEMADLQLAFFKASLANCDLPTDHGFQAILYRVADNHGLKVLISGGNLASESVLPIAWGYNALDARHLRAVHNAFGVRPLNSFPTISFFERYVWYPFVRGIQEVRLLNYIDYRSIDAKTIIQEKLGWRDYGGKHHESVFTRFFQAHYLPQKFNYDKRKAHLSSLILSGQMMRDEALQEMNKLPASPNLIDRDKEFIARKLNISLQEFVSIISQPPRTHRDFASNEFLFAIKDVLRQRYNLGASRAATRQDPSAP